MKQTTSSVKNPEQMIPHNLEAEMSVLGLLLNGRGMSLIADWLKETHFWRDAHRSIFSAMVALYQRNEGIDFITVSDELKRRNIVIQDELGGPGYLHSLNHWTFENYLSSESIEEHAHIVADMALARGGLDACGKAAQLFLHDSPTNALAKTQTLFSDLALGGTKSDFTPMAEIVEANLARIEEMQERGGVMVGIPTGFHDLDKMTNGLKNEKLILVAGRPGMGKTSWLLTVAHHVAVVLGLSVGILSLEMSKDELFERLVSIDAKIDSRRAGSGQLEVEELERFRLSAQKLKSAPIFIDDTFGCTLVELESKARRLQLEYGVDLLLVDYLQLMEADAEETDNEVKMLSLISRGLKGIARKMAIPVVAAAQLNRAVEGRQSKIPQPSDLRGSGTLEQDSDIILFLYREEEYNKETDRRGQADIIIAKHRGGPRGVVVVGFEETQTRFFNLITDEEASQYV